VIVNDEAIEETEGGSIGVVCVDGETGGGIEVERWAAEEIRGDVRSRRDERECDGSREEIEDASRGFDGDEEEESCDVIVDPDV